MLVVMFLLNPTVSHKNHSLLDEVERLTLDWIGNRWVQEEEHSEECFLLLAPDEGHHADDVSLVLTLWKNIKSSWGNSLKKCSGMTINLR